MCKLSDSVVDKEFLDCPFKYKWCSVVFGGIFSFFSLFYCLRIKASIVQLCLNSYTLTLSIKVLHRNATWTNYPQETFPCLKSLVVGIIRSLMLWGFFRRFLGYPLRFLKATLIQRWSTKFWWSWYKRVIKGEGDYWSRIENKMTVSHFKDNKFGHTIRFSYFG